MKIIADTTTLYSPEEGEENGIKIIPACTIIDNKAYKDFEEISSVEFLEKLKNGAVATTSQPVIGEIIALSSICSAIFVTVYIGLTSDSIIMLVALVIFTFLMIVRHRKNIERMIHGNENKITWM